MPNKRILPSERISKEITELIYSLKEEGDNRQILGKIVELGVCKLAQELLEGEVTEFTGNDYYAHGKRRGYRNGYKPVHLKTAERKLRIEKPQVADAPETYRSGIWPHLKRKSERLEKMAVEMYARGCSTRDVEELLKDEDGRILLSKSTISRLNERLWEEYKAFCKADLSAYDVAYIFADAVYESLRLHRSPKEGILVVWGITVEGSKILLSMRLGNKESHEDWLEVFRDLKKRNLNDPVLGTTDGAPGLMLAFEEVFHKTLRQRCLVHKKKNILNKVPVSAVAEVKLYLNNVYYAPDEETAGNAAQIFRNRFGGLYPAAVASFEDDLGACLQHLKCPARHRKYITTTNLVERSFGEEKRRSKVIPRFFDEKSGLKLAFASLIRAAQRWNRIRITFDEKIQLLELRHKLGHKAPKEMAISKNRRVPQLQKFSRTKKT